MRTVKSDSKGESQCFDIRASSLTAGGTGNLTATFVSTKAHKLSTGHLIQVKGADRAAYNTQKVKPVAVTVTNATTFTYQMDMDPGGSATITNVIANRQLPSNEYDPFSLIHRIEQRLLVLNGPEDSYISAADEASKVVKDTRGRLFGVYVRNRSGADAYLHIFDAAAVPSNGVVPHYPAQTVPATGGNFAEFPYGRLCKTGIVVVMSTTEDTLTLAGNIARFDVQFT